MSSFSQPKKRTTRFSSIDSNGEINTNINQINDSNNNSKIQSTICHLIDVISDNDLNFFYQDNNTSNGAEPIEWEVLAVKKGKALVISRYIL